jgi:hypothetical protein
LTNRFSGTNVAAMETSVRLGPDNRGYIITGKKSWVINASKCDHFIVIAKHQGMGNDLKYADTQMQFEEVITCRACMSEQFISYLFAQIQILASIFSVLESKFLI